ncbi:MAG: DUF3391 domain-containing protein [Burkholderiaceae bacterium]|nr:DUF3391 domain-containing protein [Burkholderiaceae bacterium]
MQPNEVSCVSDVRPSIAIDIDQLCIGMFIQLDMGWMNHPFPVSSFRIASHEQIALLRQLGITSVRYVPEKSDTDFQSVDKQGGSALPPLLGASELPERPVQSLGVDSEEGAVNTVPPEPSTALDACHQRYGEATLRYGDLERRVVHHPEEARAQAEELVAEYVSELGGQGEPVIRVLSGVCGESSAYHPVNVMVISLLLGKALGLHQAALHDLGLAALLHDIGKIMLPLPWRQSDATAWIPAQAGPYEAHVGESVALVARMGLPDTVQIPVAQHHERVDGSGFPRHLKAGRLGLSSQILALVNHYDRLCNPASALREKTPHEALSVIFAQHKERFDPVVLASFIRMMGVYPPGSIVQLVNGQFAMVVSVNPARPLRPRVLVHDPRVPREQATIVSLDTLPDLGILRSLRPSQLPREALDYLSPHPRICYFFERATDPGPREANL